MRGHSNIQSDLSDSGTTHFLVLLPDKHRGTVDRWVRALERHYQKPVRPIFILSTPNHPSVTPQDFMILPDAEHKKHQAKWPGDTITYIPSFSEDRSELAGKNPAVRRLILKLARKQPEVPVLAFSSFMLDFGDLPVRILGPERRVAEYYESKAHYFDTFRELGLVRHSVETFPGFKTLLEKNTTYPAFISAARSAGGREAVIAQSRQDVAALKPNIRPRNLTQPFVVSALIPDIISTPNVTAIAVDKADVRIISITDQVLRGHSYMGNIYPSLTPETLQQKLKADTKKIGQHMAKNGFRGLFGVDFLIDAKGAAYPIDLNPRRQGGYISNALMTDKVDLIEQECRLAFNKPVDDFDEADLKLDFAWAHSQLSLPPPHTYPARLASHVHHSAPEEVFKNIGNSHYISYYPTDSLLIKGNPGLYLTTGLTRDDVLTRLLQDVEKLTKQLYNL